MTDFNYYFTITGGRTGTDWLSSFIGENLKIESIHESPMVMTIPLVILAIGAVFLVFYLMIYL